MQVQTLFFAHYQDIVGASVKTLTLPDSATVNDMIAFLRRDYPALDIAASHGRVAVNLEFAEGDRVLTDGDEVALMPPMSGG
jgi:molybdopterin converting factor subunit 1